MPPLPRPGLEHYSTLDEGALYRFLWLSPTQKHIPGGIGFGAAETLRRLSRLIDARCMRR